ncbi:MAG: DctP family TRAP transporter solute-binding subunit [Schwartzia sp.]|nr:DctP family TRAP transporter solute-binding subunit [Schwartzia sp. (in: firmicutes)]
MRGISRGIQLICLVLCLALLAGCGASKGAGGGKVELKLAYHLPVDHHLSKSVERFAKKVAEKSKGSVTVTTYPAGQLYTDKSMNDAIMSGGLDMGLNSTAMWTTVIPVLNVLDVPFLLPTYESVGKAIDGGLGKTLAAEMEKKGVHPLIWADYGYIQFCNNTRPIKTPADFKGLQLRGYGQIPAETIKALGGSPVTMGAAEVYTAIQRGTIDGQTSGQTAMYSRKMYEVAKYLTVTNHAFCEFVLAMNKAKFDSLTPEQRKAVEEAAQETRDEIRKETKDEDAASLKKLKEKGMEVYEVPAAEVKLWQDATKKVREDFIQANGEIGKQAVEECLKAGK